MMTRRVIALSDQRVGTASILSEAQENSRKKRGISLTFMSLRAVSRTYPHAVGDPDQKGIITGPRNNSYRFNFILQL